MNDFSQNASAFNSDWLHLKSLMWVELPPELWPPQCQRHLFTQTCSSRLSAILQTVYDMCITKFFHLLSLGANPWAKVHQKGRWPATTQFYHPAKFHRPTSTHTGDIPYKTILRTNTVAQTNKQTNSKQYIPSMPISMCW